MPMSPCSRGPWSAMLSSALDIIITIVEKEAPLLAMGHGQRKQGGARRATAGVRLWRRFWAGQGALWAWRRCTEESAPSAVCAQMRCGMGEH